MITTAEYLAAKAVVEQYQREQYLKETQQSAKVRLSKWGKEMQNPHDKTGTIVSRSLAGLYDYTVEVLWEDGKKEFMHESQVETA
jgi:hypothetical protein